MICNFFKTWWPSLLTIVVVLYATLWPDPVGAEEATLFEGADKLIHAIMMGGVAAAILFDHRRSGGTLSKKYILTIGVSTVIFAAIDEMAQSAMCLGRQSDLADFLADTGGTVIASLAAPPVINRIFCKKQPTHTA